MDREQVRRWEAQCIQEQPPACASSCPIHVDARKLVECVSRADFSAGLAALATATPLASILAHVCDHPCRPHCRRADAGDAIEISALERACATYGSRPSTSRPSLQKTHRVAVIGGGLSGVTAAAGLASRGYQVTIFESRPTLLHRMRSLDEALLPPHVIDANLAILDALEVTVHTGAFISRHEGPLGLGAVVEQFDAVYLATGPELFDESALGLERNEQGRIRIDALTLATSHAKLFAGGSQRYATATYSPIASVADGNYATVSIDRFLQGASLTANRDNQGPYLSRLYVKTIDLEPLAAVRPAISGAAYSKEEAQQEAHRCIPCQCLECVKVCQYLEDYGSYPKRYVRQIYNNECIVMGVRKANRMVNSCALCGLCAAVCPEKLSMADVCLDARQSLVLMGKMPPSAHDFALRDMAFSQSDAFALARHQPGFSSSETAFLPGCQLSASSPDHVAACYEHLRKTASRGVGLILECCGAPARWAGDEPKFQAALARMDAAWTSLGKPRLITACSSCFKTLHEHLPQIPVEPLWPHLASAPPDRKPAATENRSFAIHDPCSTRGVAEVEESARTLLRSVGVTPRELNNRGLTTCCGYGGLMLFANPSLADKTVSRRANQASVDYVTYCAMCRDRFAHQGKRAIHILDLVFGSSSKDPVDRPDPGFSQRQENRARLKSRLLQDIWGERENVMEPPLNLQIADDIRQLMEKRMILVEDVRRTIAYAEETGERIDNPVTGHSLASLRSACVTYWVEYLAQGEAFVVTDAYSHRMEVR